MITGIYNVVANPSVTRNVNTERVELLCDTSGGPVTINLPKIADYKGFNNVKYFINDETGNAGTNPITIVCHPTNKIDGGASSVINTNRGSAMVQISDNDDWISLEAYSAAPPAADVLIIPLIAGQVSPIAAGNYTDDTQFTATGCQLVMPTGRPRAIGISVGAIVSVAPAIFQLWNATDGVMIQEILANVSGAETPASFPVQAPQSSLKGKTVQLRVKPGLGGSVSITGAGGMIEADNVQLLQQGPVFNDLYNEFAIASQGYVTKANIGVINSLTTGTFSADIRCSYQRSAEFDNFGGASITEADANSAPKTYNATTIKSDVSVIVRSLSPVGPPANRLFVGISVEAYTSHL